MEVEKRGIESDVDERCTQLAHSGDRGVGERVDFRIAAKEIPEHTETSPLQGALLQELREVLVVAPRTPAASAAGAGPGSERGCTLCTSRVSGSFGSAPTIVFSRMAMSVTERAMGPAVSKFRFFGAMPSRLMSPVVGLRPTIPVKAAGPRTDVLVSVPMARTVKLAATDAAEPLLEPPVSRLTL